MPRVNRDLQRRMAARRERERRRPTERRYRFGSTEPTRVADERAPDEALDGTPTPEAPEAEADSLAGARRRGSASAAAPSPPVRSPGVRGATTNARPAPRPFSAYRDEYRYVLGDLRRVALVMGSLLLVLIVLSLVLPR